MHMIKIIMMLLYTSANGNSATSQQVEFLNMEACLKAVVVSEKHYGVKAWCFPNAVTNANETPSTFTIIEKDGTKTRVK